MLLQAYDQPDVYETKDLPEADQNADIIEEVNLNVDLLVIVDDLCLSLTVDISDLNMHGLKQFHFVSIPDSQKQILTWKNSLFLKHLIC